MSSINRTEVVDAGQNRTSDNFCAAENFPRSVTYCQSSPLHKFRHS